MKHLGLYIDNKDISTKEKVIGSSDNSVSNVIALTKAEYDALTPAEKAGNTYITTDEPEASMELATQTTSGLMSAGDKVKLDEARWKRYITAIAGSNGDFYITLQGTLATNDIVYINFPTATNGTSNARLSVDGGATYKDIKLVTIRLASGVQNRKLSFVYDGTDFVPLETEFFANAYTPTITCSTGTITSTTTNCSYIQVGRLVTCYIDVTITNKGTGAGELFVTAPLPVNRFGAGVGKENAVIGFVVSIIANTTYGFIINKYDQTTAIATNYRIIGTITYMTD